MKDYEARLARLETAVFGASGEYLQSNRSLVMEQELLLRTMQQLVPWGQGLAKGDHLVLQVVISGTPQEKITGHASTLDVLREEEDDEGVARLCSVLGSKQRISILKHLTKTGMTNGELADKTGMTGGHLHHHLRDLMSLVLVEKREDGKYVATEAGVNTYLTVSALHRRLVHDDKATSQMTLPTVDNHLLQGGVDREC